MGLAIAIKTRFGTATGPGIIKSLSSVLIIEITADMLFQLFDFC
jgi:hypothetical protein